MEFKDVKYYAITDSSNIKEHLISADDEIDLQNSLIDVEERYNKNNISVILVSEKGFDNIKRVITQYKKC
jgi:vacuolar-type H+-ATPase subunit F/Vma7